MKKTTTYSMLALIVSAACFLGACKWGAARTTPAGRNVICLIDFSDGSTAAERLDFYRQTIQKHILPALQPTDKLIIIPIDKASVTNASDILSADLSKKSFVPDDVSPTEEDEVTQKNLRLYADTLSRQLDKSMADAIASRRGTMHGTDILGALDVLKGKLKKGDDNYLVFFSDMMNWGPELKMEPGDKAFNVANLSSCLEKTIPLKMDRTTALVLTGEQNGADPEHFKLVRTFWTKYFEKNQINLYDYSSASPAKLDEMMALPVSKP
ncbi:hypothetical protein [Mucilaginibacter sp. HD30]